VAGSCCPALDEELQPCCPGFKEQQLFEPCIGQDVLDVLDVLDALDVLDVLDGGGIRW